MLLYYVFARLLEVRFLNFSDQNAVSRDCPAKTVVLRHYIHMSLHKATPTYLID